MKPIFRKIARAAVWLLMISWLPALVLYSATWGLKTLQLMFVIFSLVMLPIFSFLVGTLIKEWIVFLHDAYMDFCEWKKENDKKII